MDKELKAKWLVALRGGEIKQAKGKLLAADGSMCCIGVLGRVCGVPDAVLLKHANKLKGDELGFIDEAFPITGRWTLAEMNDGDEDEGVAPKSFAEIADYIEARL